MLLARSFVQNLGIKKAKFTSRLLKYMNWNKIRANEHRSFYLKKSIKFNKSLIL
jgi:hypothetical protein